MSLAIDRCALNGDCESGQRSVRPAGQCTDHRGKVLQIGRVEGDAQTMRSGSDHAIHGIDIVAEPEFRRLHDRPIEIPRQEIYNLEVSQQLDGAALPVQVSNTVEDLQPDDGSDAEILLLSDPGPCRWMGTQQIYYDNRVEKAAYHPRRSRRRRRCS